MSRGYSVCEDAVLQVLNLHQIKVEMVKVVLDALDLVWTANDRGLGLLRVQEPGQVLPGGLLIHSEGG